MKKLLLGLAALAGAGAPAAPHMVNGINLTETGVHRYDAAEPGDPKTEAQTMVDRLWALGVRHVALSPRAIMRSPDESKVTFLTPVERLAAERAGYLRLIEYIHRRGMTTAIRPLLFVVNEILNPFIELGGVRTPGAGWVWHGDIRPADVTAWFASFREYLDYYAAIARVAGVEEFTLGAELHSMTVGLGGSGGKGEPAGVYQCGYPGEWAKLAAWLRTRLPGVRLMYDINFTDAPAAPVPPHGHPLWLGGEFARWCERLVRQVPECPADDGALVAFWNSLDAVGLDFYRSLALPEQVTVERYPELVGILRLASDRFAAQVDNCLFEIQYAVGHDMPLIVKDVGYRSVKQGYLNPFQYATAGGVYDDGPQAASYEAILQSFQGPRWPWFHGIVFWDAPVDLDRHGPGDIGFSPVGKPRTEEVLRRYFAPGP